MKKSVEVQKGPIKPHTDSYRIMTRPAREREAADAVNMKRDAQALKEHRPK